MYTCMWCVSVAGTWRTQRTARGMGNVGGACLCGVRVCTGMRVSAHVCTPGPRQWDGRRRQFTSGTPRWRGPGPAVSALPARKRTPGLPRPRGLRPAPLLSDPTPRLLPALRLLPGSGPARSRDVLRSRAGSESGLFPPAPHPWVAPLPLPGCAGSTLTGEPARLTEPRVSGLRLPSLSRHWFPVALTNLSVTLNMTPMRTPWHPAWPGAAGRHGLCPVPRTEGGSPGRSLSPTRAPRWLCTTRLSAPLTLLLAGAAWPRCQEEPGACQPSRRRPPDARSAEPAFPVGQPVALGGRPRPPVSVWPSPRGRDPGVPPPTPSQWRDHPWPGPPWWPTSGPSLPAASRRAGPRARRGAAEGTR